MTLEGRYLVEGKLGEGGMATVFRAHDLRHDRPVAIKCLHQELAHAIGPDRFLSEIRLTAKLQHPHILALLDSGEADGIPFYVMPFVAGETLRDRLDRDGRMPVTEAIQLVERVADALDYAHRHGIVHRDIKPANLLVQDGQVVVADFGIALAVRTQEDGRLTQAGLSLGTPAYMSPEQVTADPNIDGRSDIYSLACVLYEMLAGAPVFNGTSAADVMRKQVVDVPASVSTLRPEVPGGVAAAIDRALAKAPADRFATAAAFVAALHAEAPAAPNERRSIVVLPFTNMSADKEHEYFSDGLTDEVIATLSKLRSLRVISRTSAMRYKGGTTDIRTVARELGVRYALEGAVRRAGPRLRITAQLIDAQRDVHLWSEKYDGVVDDVFEMQDRVSAAIVKTLAVTLTSDESQSVAARRIPNVEAFDHYLRAREGLDLFTETGLHAAQVHLEAARALVGDHPLVLRGLAIADWQTVNAGLTDDFSLLDRVLDYAQRIQDVDAESPYVPQLRGLVHMRRADMPAALRDLATAHRIDDSDAEIMYWYSVALVFTGQFARARAISMQARLQDPHNTVIGSLEAAALCFQGRFDDAAQTLRNLVRLSQLPMNRFLLAAALAYGGKRDEAVETLRALAGSSDWPNDMFADLSRFLLAAFREDGPAARLALTEHVRTRAWADFGYAAWVAQGWAVIGEHEEALRWLARSVSRGFCCVDFIVKLNPLLARIRTDPAFVPIAEMLRARAAEVDDVASRTWSGAHTRN